VEPENYRKDPLRFASLIAHQLQSPLNAVSTSLRSLLEEYAGPLLPKQRASLERASARCDQALTAVRRMLTIFKADADQETRVEPAALASAVRRVHAEYQAEAAKRDIALRLELHAEGLSVALGEAALLEMLSVLLDNALKYTPEHGRVCIATRPGSTAETVVVAVADSGVGVPETEREKIFEPFYRGAAAKDSARPGVGLGLAFVKSVVTRARGTVTVRKADLGGAEFVVELPLAPAPAEGATAAAPRLRVVVVGGVTAGPKAAAKIFRLVPDADITIVEKGSVMAYGGCGLPYYVSGVVRDQKSLISSPAGVVRDPVFFRQVMNVHVLNQTEALEVDRNAKAVRVRDAVTGREWRLPYDKLLLATGSSPFLPPGLKTELKNVFTLHGVRDAEGIKTALADEMARDVVIVGGGLIGIEITEALVQKGARVTILEARPQILSVLDPDMARLVQRHMEAHGVRILTQAAARALEGKGKVSAVVTDAGPVPADLVILACGIRPNTELAVQAGLAIGATGAIAVNQYLQTSDPDIYAAGDCATALHRVTGKPYYLPLGSTASKQGRVAAVNICGGQEVFEGVVGTCICKVFDYTVARTGLGEAEARQHGFAVATALAAGPDREHFMPTARSLLLKLIVDRASRRLLGAQAVGPGAGDKRVDVAAMAIMAGLTVDRLAQADLCYAPSYAPAMDNIITAANLARNKLDGIMVTVSADEVYQMLKRGEEFVFLDVRTPEEYERVRLPRAVSMPLGALRGRMNELPQGRPIVTFCDISLRGYEAALMLQAAGFANVRVMEGGMAAWPYERVE